MDSSLLVFDVGYVCKSAITFFRFLLKSTIEKERKRKRENCALSQRNFVPSLTRILEEKNLETTEEFRSSFPRESA